jgi:hypothetical protein
VPPIVRRRKLNALPMSEADRQGAITPDASSCCGSQAQGEKAGGTDLQRRRPTSQYARLFSGLRRSTSREYLVLLANGAAIALIGGATASWPRAATRESVADRRADAACRFG